MRMAALGGAFLLTPVSSQAQTPFTVAQAYDAACPEQWKLLNVEIKPADFTTTPWANAADRAAFKEYWQRYIIHSTLDTTQFDALADDPVTVASECALRRDKVVDNYFAKAIDTVTTWARKVNIIPIIMMLFNG